MRIPNANYLIVDVEATCGNEGAVPRDEMEIIEIGALVQNARTFAIEAEFQTFVKPVRHPTLTPFCTQLTSISQREVERAPDFLAALDAMKEWMNSYDDSLFCSWGDYDRLQFLQDCAHHAAPYPFPSGHFNIKTAFSRALGTRKRYGIAGALKRLGMSFAGTHHRGIDDVRNIARIVREVCIRAEKER